MYLTWLHSGCNVLLLSGMAHVASSNLSFFALYGLCRVALYAARDLRAGEELTFDYGSAFKLP